MGMNDFLEGYTFKTLRPGEIVRGKVIKVSDEGIIANIGYKSDAFVPKNELSLNPNFDVKKTFNVEDELDLYIISVENDEGNVLASKVMADDKLSREKIEKAYKNKEIIEGEVIEVVKGGVIAYSLGAKVFVPASQLELHYVDKLNEYLGKTLRLRIIEYIPGKKIVGSQKEVMKLEREKAKKALLSNLKEGDIVEGKVKNIIDKGAFVDIGGFDGFIPLSEISWERIKNPREVLEIGDKVSVYILNVDEKNEKITLSLRRVLPDPWENAEAKYHEGDVLKGTITNITPFGVFVQLEAGIEGLVHKNNLENNIKAYKMNDIIGVEILNINQQDKKINLKEVPLEEDIVEIEHQELRITLGEIFNKNF
ncbi:SSU ribosomal protein S1P [Thermoanaerobacter uzonensis DSM 18761]|jgi:small subunit ribosomal protein S1|uniref:SSU ribosomal protein S1P n=1 Tax=Thermoanaerobacter uzonensis DSM 18761 TaxID=1123369 RepID=A0A1M4V134_9THEO|nr:S1 RNA-binding domain-containing protein [Thermoanaerobacter uzonensis]SHE62639.1 SSU ribosomal protein S1P [Thermoanaerobacter uzonensis DSM 18761]